MPSNTKIELAWLAVTGVLLAGWCGLAAGTEIGPVCGNRLADILSLVCADRGFYRHASKRAEPDYSLEDIRLPTTKRSVVDECCRRSCTLAVIESYCAPASTNYNTYDIMSQISQQFSRPGSNRNRPSFSAAQPTPPPWVRRLRPRPTGNHQSLRQLSYFYVTPARREFHYRQ